jgi:hypothetical protein
MLISMRYVRSTGYACAMTFDIHFIQPRHDRAESLIGHRSEYLISRGNQPVVRRCKESLLIGLSVAYICTNI